MSSNEPDSEALPLFFFGRPCSSHSDRVGLRGKWLLLLRLKGSPVGAFTAQTPGKLASIVRVNVGVVLSPRNGYVREAVVNQELAFFGVDVDQHSIRGLPRLLWLVTAYP